MSNQTPLPPLTADDTAMIASRYAYGAAETNGTDYNAELDRFRAWVTFMQQQATLNLERMVQELEAENARLQTELAEAESQLEEAWSRGYQDAWHNLDNNEPFKTNPYRIGGDVQ